MTDKSVPPLNLIERMAQRLASQNTETTPKVNGTEREVTSLRPDVHVETNAPKRPAASEEFRSPGMSRRTESEPAAKVAPVPKIEPALRPTGGERSKQVSLDFRVLRQTGMITPDHLSSPLSNEFRSIKRKLLQRARDPKTREAVNNLIMVTSSIPGEGKTFTSVNLAISLAAERGLQVLLIDADVVRPSIGNMFKATPHDGLTDYLSGRVSQVSDIMSRCVEIPNLSVIFSGGAQVDSPELISSGRMADLCTDLSTRYPDRVIVIDTPPVLASAEPALLASFVHQLVMVVGANQIQKHQLAKSLEAVASCRNVSLLFNKAPRWNDPEYTAYYGYANPATPAASS